MEIKWDSPSSIIGGMIALLVVIPIILLAFPEITTGLINLSQLSDFKFASFFESGGVAFILLSVGVLAGIFGYFGYKILKGGSKR